MACLAEARPGCNRNLFCKQWLCVCTPHTNKKLDQQSLIVQKFFKEFVRRMGISKIFIVNVIYIWVNNFCYLLFGACREKRPGFPFQSFCKGGTKRISTSILHAGVSSSRGKIRFQTQFYYMWNCFIKEYSQWRCMSNCSGNPFACLLQKIETKSATRCLFAGHAQIFLMKCKIITRKKDTKKG